MLDITQIPLRRLCDKVTDLSRTQIMKVHNKITSLTFMICVRDKSTTLSETCCGLCCRLSPCIVTGQILLEWHKRVCRGLVMDFVANILSRWFVFATFVICVGDFHRNFMVSRFVTVCVHNFHNLCPRLSMWGSFSESQRNWIWAYLINYSSLWYFFSIVIMILIFLLVLWHFSRQLEGPCFC